MLSMHVPAARSDRALTISCPPLFAQTPAEAGGPHWWSTGTRSPPRARRSHMIGFDMHVQQLVPAPLVEGPHSCYGLCAFLSIKALNTRMLLKPASYSMVVYGYATKGDLGGSS